MNSTKTSEQNRKFLKIQRILAITVCSIIGAVFIYCYIKYGNRLLEIFGNPQSLKEYLSKFKGYDKLGFVLIRAFQTVIKIIPAEPLEIGSGVLYGTWGGLLYCMLGTEIGSMVIILLTKIFGIRLVNLFVPIEKINSLKFLQNEKGVYFTLFIIYLIPGTPKDVITYIASLTKMNMFKFLLITGIARIPSIITSTICGEQILNHNYNLAITVFVLTALAGVISSFLYKKYSDKLKSKKENNHQGEI